MTMSESSPRLLIAVTLLHLLLTYCEGTSGCPEVCTCTQQDIDTTLVDCSNRALTSIPKFPDTATEILLNGNQLGSVRDGAFSTTPFLKRLDLSSNGLNSLDLGAFTGLASLEYLDLSVNNLDVDDTKNHELFRGCKYIRELNLSNNRLTSIPSHGLKILTRLEKLVIRDNSITNPVFGPEFVSLELLSDVDISGNRFDQVPAHAFQILKSLTAVNISRCNIKRIASGLFSEFRTLQTFDISDNIGINIDDLNATIRAISQSPELSTLRLANLNISDISGMLAPLTDTDLRILDLSYNSIVYIHASDLRAPRKLRELYLRHNNLVNLTSFSLSYLQKLDLSHNRIGEVTERNLEGVPEVRELDLSYNKLTELRSEPFARNLFIETLDLSYNLITTIYEIQHLESLQVLSLRGNVIRDPRALFKLFNLHDLDLSYNAIPSLSNNMITEKLDRFTTLNLSHNVIEYIQGGTFNIWSPLTIDLSSNRLPSMEAWGLTLVKHLNLSDNQIQFVSDQALANLNYLESLDLSVNKLSTLPTSMLSHLAELRRLDLSDNELGGFLEGQMGKAMFTARKPSALLLEHLNLENTGLTTIQPAMFADVSRLEHLDLSHNKLKEVKSSQLQGLGLLRVLDLSYNELTGFNVSAIDGLVSLKSIDLSNVKWICDCSIVSMKAWIDSTDVQIVNYDSADTQYVCNEPQQLKGKTLSEISLDDQNCAVTVMEKTIILIIIGCTTFVIFIALAIIFWQHRWRLKKKLKKQHYRAMYEGGQSQLQGMNGQTTTAQTYTHHHQHHLAHPHHQHTPPLPPNKMTYSMADAHHNGNSGHAFV